MGISFHAGAVTNFSNLSSYAATMPATSIGDGLLAFSSVDNSPSTLTPPGGWLLLGTLANSTVDGQQLNVYVYTGGATAGLPSTFTWELGGGISSDAQIAIYSITGWNGLFDFITATNTTTSFASPISATFAGGTMSANAMCMVMMALDKTITTAATWSFGTPTGSPGTFTLQTNSDPTGFFAGIGMGYVAGVSAGASGTISDTITQTSGTNPAGYCGLVLSLQAGPMIQVQPQSVGASVGQTVNFSVTAVGAGSLSYQWKVNGVNQGTNSSSFTWGPLALSDQSDVVTVTVTDSNGSTPSSNAFITVIGGGSSRTASGDGFVGSRDGGTRVMFRHAEYPGETEGLLRGARGRSQRQGRPRVRDLHLRSLLLCHRGPARRGAGAGRGGRVLPGVYGSDLRPLQCRDEPHPAVRALPEEAG